MKYERSSSKFNNTSSAAPQMSFSQHYLVYETLRQLGELESWEVDGAVTRSSLLQSSLIGVLNRATVLVAISLKPIVNRLQHVTTKRTEISNPGR